VKSDLQTVVMCPGNGWKRIAGAVYERNDGLRLHMLGCCRLPSSKSVVGYDAENYYLQNKLIAINGGNRKRGLMAWAATLAVEPS